MKVPSVHLFLLFLICAGLGFAVAANVVNARLGVDRSLNGLRRDQIIEVKLGESLVVNLEQKISPHDVQTLQQTEESIEEVVGREGGGELDGIENG